MLGGYNSKCIPKRETDFAAWQSPDSHWFRAQWQTAQVVISASSHLTRADSPVGWRRKNHSLRDFFFFNKWKIYGDEEGCYNQVAVGMC